MKKIFSLFSLTLILLLGFGFAQSASADNDKNNSNRNNDRSYNERNRPNQNNNKPPVVYIFATKYSIKAGKSTELYLKTKNTIDSCTASGGWTGVKSKDVREKVSPLVTTTYTITCTNAYGSYSDSVEIYVKNKGTTTPPVIPPATTTPPVSTTTLSFSGNPLSITNGATSTLTWTSTNANFCLASGAWTGNQSLGSSTIVSPSATSTYTLSCGGLGGTTTASVTINVSPTTTPPVASLDHVVISEVYYDVDPTKGVESTNEWIELYNDTDSSIDIGGWVVADTSDEFDLVPLGTTIPANSFVVLTASTTTLGFWGSVPMVSLGNRLGNALGNTGDSIYLKNAASTTVDSMSYGSTTPVAFTPTVPIVSEGHSLKRANLLVDTNSSIDWQDETTPTPGSF